MHNPMIGRVTSHYDLKRRHPVFKTVQPHRGIDLGAPVGIKPWDYIGAPIRAAYAGVVEAVESNWRTGWGCIWGRSGNGVFIRNADGEGQYYGHLSTVNVRRGQRVNKGDVIGGMGVSGNVTGPHLHFEIHARGSGITNRYTWTRDPMADFRAAGLTPGVDPAPVIIPASTKTPAPTAPAPEKDWFDMATEADLTRIVRDELASLRAEVDAVNKRLDSLGSEARDARTATEAAIAAVPGKVWDEPLSYYDISRDTVREVPARTHQLYQSQGNGKIYKGLTVKPAAKQEEVDA